MKKETLSNQIFTKAKSKGLYPHSILNKCMLSFIDGTCIIGKNKKDLLNKIINL